MSGSLFHYPTFKGFVNVLKEGGTTALESAIATLCCTADTDGRAASV
ncbi:hypothetical protein [Leptodesmis sp.]